MKYVEKLQVYVKTPRGEDFVDMLNCRATSWVLIVLAVFIFARDYIGSPIQCWGNAEWKKGWVQYSHDYCYVENTYYVPMEQKGIPYERTELMREQEINYYQWVPFILILQGLFFMAPLIFWKTFDECVSGISVQPILSMAKDAGVSLTGLDKSERATIAHHLSSALENKFIRGRSFFKALRNFFNQRTLSFVYCITKLLFIANSSIQFYLLGQVLGKSSQIWGFSTLNALRKGESWIDTGLFPRVTMCDLQVRQGGGGHVQKYTVQCVLTGNMVNEKIFVFLWWWLILLNAISIVNLFQWVYALFSKHQRYQSFKSMLQLSADLLFPDPRIQQAYIANEDMPVFEQSGDEESEEEEEEAEEEEESDQEDEEQQHEEESEEEDDSIPEASSSGSPTNDSTLPIRDSASPHMKNAQNAGWKVDFETNEHGTTYQNSSAASSHNSDPIKGNATEAKKESKKPKKPVKTKEERDTERLEKKKRKFVQKMADDGHAFFRYLGTDGLLMLELMKINSSNMVACAVLGHMFTHYVPGVSKRWAADEKFMPLGSTAHGEKNKRNAGSEV